jgi:OOP family OmpA-OmpF porin
MTQVLFDFGKSTLRNSSYAVIDRVYDELQKDKDAYVTIDGNTDQVGTEEYNQALSERRAAAVKNYLVGKGISESRIQEKGHGENDPAATNSTVEGRSKNRRAELLIKIRK